MSEDTVDRVIGVVYSKFKEHAEGKKITPQTEFKKDLGADSLDAVELSMLLEDEFDIGISDDKMEGVDTVRKAIALVDSLLKGWRLSYLCLGYVLMFKDLLGTVGKLRQRKLIQNTTERTS